MMNTTISIMKKILILIFCCLGFALGCTENENSESNEPNRNEQNPLMGFKATGNSPDWQLEVGFSDTISFRTEDEHNFTITEATPEAVGPPDTNAVSYRAQNEDGRLDLTILPQPCGDSRYNRKVRVSIKTDSSQPPAGYEGCGTYFGDYRLNDIWVLESISGDTLEPRTDAPTLEFHLSKQKVYGFGGCNQIEGSFETAGDSLSIGSLSAKRADCPNGETETAFLEGISNKSFRFTIQNLRLRLISNETVLVFKKVD